MVIWFGYNSKIVDAIVASNVINVVNLHVRGYFSKVKNPNYSVSRMISIPNFNKSVTNGINASGDFTCIRTVKYIPPSFGLKITHGSFVPVKIVFFI